MNSKFNKNRISPSAPVSTPRVIVFDQKTKQKPIFKKTSKIKVVPFDDKKIVKKNYRKYIYLIIGLLLLAGFGVGLYFILRPKQEKQYIKTEEVLNKYFLVENEYFGNLDSRNDIWNETINIIPEKYRQYFVNCDAKKDDDQIIKNIVCFMIDYPTDPNYDKDIMGAIILNYYIMEALSKKNLDLENIRRNIVYIKNKKIVLPVNSVIIPSPYEKRMTMEQFVDYLIESIKRMGVSKCNYC